MADSLLLVVKSLYLFKMVPRGWTQAHLTLSTRCTEDMHVLLPGLSGAYFPLLLLVYQNPAPGWRKGEKVRFFPTARNSSYGVLGPLGKYEEIVRAPSANASQCQSSSTHCHTIQPLSFSLPFISQGRSNSRLIKSSAAGINTSRLAGIVCSGQTLTLSPIWGLGSDRPVVRESNKLLTQPCTMLPSSHD